jgi:hypothetical protein
MDQSEVQAKGVKLLGAWLTTMFAKLQDVDWSQVAGFVATVYTLICIGEWMWKRFLRAFCERRGWVKPRPNAE